MLPSILDEKVPRALEYTHPTPPKHTLTSSHNLILIQYILTNVFTWIFTHKLDIWSTLEGVSGVSEWSHPQKYLTYLVRM